MPCTRPAATASICGWSTSGRPTSATLVGQLADRDHPGVDADDVRVELKTRKEILASANCNRFGEFQLDYRPAPALRLDVILGSSGKRLELPLSGLMDEPAGRQSRAKKPRTVR